MNEEHSGRAQWDDVAAQRLIGATVLIGVTHLLPEGPLQEQMFGTVISADPTDGVSIMLEGSRAGETCRLPPDLSGFQPAPPGDYRLRSTGEVVKDPDYTSTWTVDPPRH